MVASELISALMHIKGGISWRSILLVISPHFVAYLMGKLSLSKLKVFSVEEDRPTPKEVYNWRIWLTALLASTGSMLIGYDSGFIGGTTQNDYFLQSFGLENAKNSSEIISNVISCFHIAAFGGALFIYPISHRWGYKIAMCIASAVGVAGSAVMLGGASGNLAPFYLGRVLTGLTVGASTNITVVYLSEVSPAPIRGQVVALFEMGWRVGDLVGFWINYGVSEHVGKGNRQWIIPVAVQLIPAALFFFGSCILRESPRWLCQKDRDAEALKNLCWLRQLDPSHEYLGWEYGTMKSSIEFQNRTVGTGLLDPAKEVFVRNKKYFKRLGITFGLFLLQNFMGVQALNYYSVTIFKQLGVKGTNASLYSSGFFGVTKFFCTLIYVFLIVDNFGRRIAFLVSSTFCSIFFWYIGAYLKVADITNPGPGGKAAIGLMYCWTASFILAWSGGPFVWAAEVYDQNIRNFTQALNAAVSWLPIFTMTKCTTMMIDTMEYGVFFFFASIAFISIPFVFFLVPETKGIPLEAIDRLFSSKVPAYRAHKLVAAALRKEESDISEKADAKDNTEHIEVAEEKEELVDEESIYGFDR